MDRRAELMTLRVSNGWAVQALAHNGDSAWLEWTGDTYGAAVMAMVDLVRDKPDDYLIMEPDNAQP